VSSETDMLLSMNLGLILNALLAKHARGTEITMPEDHLANTSIVTETNSTD
jgi:hypothetical protein